MSLRLVAGAAVVAAASLIVTAVPAGASKVYEAGLCVGGGIAVSGGCTPTSSIPNAGRAGDVDRFFAVAFHNASALTSSDTITIDGSTGAPGIDFTGTQYKYAILTGSGECTVTSATSLADTGQSVTIDVPSLCAPISASTTISVVIGTGVTNPARAGNDYVQLSTSEDTTPVSTNTYAVTSSPGAPGTLSAASGDRSAVISWEDPATDGELAISSYSVYCSTETPPATTGTPNVTASGATATTATVSGLTNGTTYYCTVVAHNSDGPSAAPAAVTVVPATTPQAPTGLSATSGNGSLIFHWSDPSTDGGAPISGYSVYCSTETPPATTGAPNATASGATATTATVTGLANGTTYDCTVLALNAVGPSSAPTAVPGVPEPVAPGAPTTVRAAPGNGSLTISWTDPVTDGGTAISGYEVYCSTATLPATTGIPSAEVTGAATTEAVVTHLSNGVSYHCVVLALNDVGPSSPSSPVVTAIPSTVPGPPTTTEATAGNHEISLRWADPVTTGGLALTGYRAYCSTLTPPATTGAPSAQVTGAAATTATVTGLSDGVAYSCVVVAVNADGPGAPSSVAHATPSAPVPAATPTGYDLVGSDGGVFVFDAPGQTGGFYGSLPGITVHVNDIVGMVATPGNLGYFLVGADGGVFAFGTAAFKGSLPGIGVTPSAPIVGIVAAATDKGYYLVGKDGGVFAFGTAPFLGSLPGIGVQVDNIIGIATTATGSGYWLVAATGTVYAFSPATNLGTAKGSASPVSSITGTPTGKGYWITTDNGTVYHYGTAASHGTLPALHVTPVLPVIGLVDTAGTTGYWLLGQDGGIFAFTAPFYGSLPTLGVLVTNIVGAVRN